MHRSSNSKASSIPVPVLKASNQNATPSISRSAKPKNKLTISAHKPKHQNVKSSRVRSGSLSRVSLASKGATPSKFVTPKQNNHLLPSAAKTSRFSTDTVRSSFGAKSVLVWPHNDPSFKTHCIDSVSDFLISHKFAYHFQRDMLRSPSKNDFVQIFNFVYGQIKPHYELPPRFDAEIPTLLKGLAYPITLKKSMFTTVGSPHSWPAVLAMLAWLCEVVSCFSNFNAADIAFDKDFEEENVQERKFLSLVTTFQSEHEEVKCKQIVEYKDAMERAFHVLEEELEDTCQKKERLALQLEDMGSVEESLRALQSLTEQLIEDNRKLLKFNDDMKDHISAKDVERAELDAQYQELNMQHQDILAEIEELEAMKTAQQYNKSHVKVLKNRPKEIDIQIEHLKSEKKMLDEQVWTTEMEISKVRKLLGKSALKYNSACARSQMDAFEVTLTNLESAVERSEVESLPLIKSEIRRLKNEELDAHNVDMHCRREEEKVKEALRAKEDACHKLECKLKRLNEENHFEKEEMLMEEEELKRTYEEAEGRVFQARQQLVKTNLYEEQKQVKEAKKRLAAWKKREAEVRQKGESIFTYNVNLIKKAYAERNRLVVEHANRRSEFMKKGLGECEEITESINSHFQKVQHLLSADLSSTSAP